MIELYAKGQTDFTLHGIALRATEAEVNYQDNGRYDADLVMPYDASIFIDYGMILRFPVPKQEIGDITLGTVSYWEISSGMTNVKLYKTVPKTTYIRYTNWYPNPWNAGDKVSFNNKNWQCTQDLRDQAITANPFTGSPYWNEIPRSKTTGGEVLNTLNAGDIVIKTGDFSSQYMKAADMNGHEGFIEISKCTDMSQTETRIVPGFTITKQSFVITEINKSSDKKTVRIHAEHVSYQLGRTMLGDCNITRATPATAIALMRGAMEETYPGAVETNLTEETITGDWSWKNAQAAILDPKDGLLKQTGGTMIRNDTDVYLLAQGSTETRYRITYGTNMSAIKWDGNIGNLVTRIYPIAQTEDGNTLLLPERYIDSVRTVPYVRPESLKTGLKIGAKEKQEDGSEITLDQDTVFARMREQAANRFNIDECDKVVISLDIDWQHLPDTEEFREYAELQNAAPGEWVQVTNGPLGISEAIQMTGYTFDALRERYKKGTFGKKTNSPTVASYNIQNGAVTGRAIASGAVGSANLQAGSITAREIEANSITSDLIAARSITSQLIMAGAITADEINAGAVTAAKIAAEAVTAEKIAAGAITAVKIAAGAVTADRIAAGAIDATKIDTNAISAINAKLGTATVTNGYIDNAVISFADIKAATAESLFARDAITDKYYIDKLAVNSAQMAYATVGELIVKATNDHYYRLDVDANGAISPTDVTENLTAGEITAGVTSNGRSAILETDLTVQDLSASTMKVINALIDKLTANRIDVSELWARQAFINELMVTDISSNTYIQSTIGNWVSGSTITQTIDSLDSRISSLGYGTVYMQPEEPSHSELVPGDIWIQTQASGTWEQVYQDYATWQTIYNDVGTWQTLGGVSIMWVWDGRKWQKQLDNLDADTFETEIQQNAQQIALLATRTTAVESDLENKYTIQSGITITAEGISISGSQFVKIASGGVFAVTTGNFGIDSESPTYVIWAGASTAANSPFWVKKDGSIKATNGTIGGWNLAENSLSSGSGSSYVNLNSKASIDYTMWAGAELAAEAPFRVKRDGTVYLTSLIAVGENGTETTVNLRTAGLWKLGYHTVKSVSTSGGYASSMTLSNGTTVNFKSAASAREEGWGAAYNNVRWPQAGSGTSVTFRAPTGSEGDAPNYSQREYTLSRSDQNIVLTNGGITYAAIKAYSRQPTWTHSMVTASVVNVSCSVDGYTYTTQFSI